MAARLNGRVVVLQFKASNTVLSSGARRFLAPHDQMAKLRNLCRSPRSVYYVLPTFGTTADLVVNPCVLPQLRFLDLHGFPRQIPVPTVSRSPKSKANRKSGLHYADLDPKSGTVTIHSEQFKQPTVSGEEWLDGWLMTDETGFGVEAAALADSVWLEAFTPGAIAGIIVRRAGNDAAERPESP
jgi:hypothetical protein